MSHPAEITEQWQALAEAAHTEHEPTPAMRRVAAVLEEAGLAVTFIDGVLYADDIDGPDADGQYDLHASFRVTQEA